MRRAGITDVPTLLADGGDEEIREISSSTRTRTWIGSYQKLSAMRPVEGSATGAGYTVVKTKLVNDKGGQGKLTVFLIKDRVPTVGNYGGPPVVAPTVTRDWERFTRPLRQHPKFAGISVQDWAQIDAWEKEEKADLRTQFKYRTQTGWSASGKPEYEEHELTAGGPIRAYCVRKLKGVDSYDCWRPITRRESIVKYKPASARCGFPDAPPESVSGYSYLKTVDSVTNQAAKGMWRHTEVWEGWQTLDLLLYGDETAGLPAIKSPAKKGVHRGTAV